MANTNTIFLYDAFYQKFKQHPSSINNSITLTQMWAELFDEILPKIFAKKKNQSNQLDNEFKTFQNDIIPELDSVIRAKSNANGNVYEMFKAQALSSANAVTRQFNTKLGLFWERVASLSSNVISPELHFGFKIPGVDVIVYYNNKLYYTQLKTQKNTLTGSQAGRVDSELSLFDNSWFVACIDNDAKWTYYGNIPKLIGDEFWSKTDIDYDDLLDNLNHTINLVEELLN